jgi:hypothetical protein
MPLIVNVDVKRKIAGIVILIVIFVILGSILILERPQDPDFMDYKVQANKIFKDAKIQFELLRGVTLPANIKLSVYTKQQAINKWSKDPSSVDTASVLRQENIYKSLFLMSENESLSNAAADWIASWTAVTVDNEIYVIYENFWPWDTPGAEAVLIHELTHVWQNSLPSPNSYDADKAQNALIEGDASYMANYYCGTQQPDNNNSSNTKINYPTSLPAFIHLSSWNFAYPTVPDAVKNLNWFPYIQGETFVSAIVDTYGWDRLNQCYNVSSIYVPSSTAQILHPNKYFAGETAIPTLTPTPQDNSWIIIPSSYGVSSDTYGEYFIYLMLSQWLNESQAQTAATGWGGDSFTYYEKNNDFLFTWNITWGSIQDASEFNKSFIDMVKFTQAKPQGNSDNQWLTNDRYLTLTWNPNTTTTLIICSNNQTATNPSFFTKQ